MSLIDVLWVVGVVAVINNNEVTELKKEKNPIAIDELIPPAAQEEMRRIVSYYKSLGYKAVIPKPRPGQMMSCFVIDFIAPKDCKDEN